MANDHTPVPGVYPRERRATGPLRARWSARFHARLRARPHANLRPRLLALLLLLAVPALAGCTGPSEPHGARDPFSGPPEGSIEDTVRLDENTFLFPPFGATIPIRVRVTLEVISGGPIDAWIATKEQCEKYGTRAFTPAASLLNTMGGTLVAEFAPGDNCLILDNADFAAGRAAAVESAVVQYRIDVWER